MRIGNHDYTFAEKKYGKKGRGVLVIINGIGAKNNKEGYRLGRDYNPHDKDSNWYLKQQHYNLFYRELGIAVANRLENGQQNWNDHISWPNTIHARIHRIEYHAIREDLYYS